MHCQHTPSATQPHTATGARVPRSPVRQGTDARSPNAAMSACPWVLEAAMQRCTLRALRALMELYALEHGCVTP